VGYAAEAADAEGVEEISSTSMLVIQHMPMEIELAPPRGVDLYDDALTVAEGDTIEPLTCAALAVPQAEVVWLKDGETVSGDASLRFSEPIQRSDGGEYTCRATNQHGTAQQAVLLNVQHAPQQAVLLNVQHAPQCSVSFEEQEELLELKCEAVGYPQDFVFWWRHNSQSFEGQMIDGFSLLSLKKESVNNSQSFEGQMIDGFSLLSLKKESVNVSVLNEYVCMVNNTMGQSEPCSLPSHGLLVDNPLLLFAVVGGAVLALLLLLFLAWCLCCRDNAGDPAEKGKSLSPSKQPHSDNAFYDNLPFHGLKQPPKQILNSADDNLVYADVDAQETYSYGPLAYKSASLQRANKKKLEESKL